jgi:hypothetical protein
VFAGVFSLTAAEAVVGHIEPDIKTPQAVAESVLDSLGVLVTSSLIQRSDDSHGETRLAC